MAGLEEEEAQGAEEKTRRSPRPTSCCSSRTRRARSRLGNRNRPSAATVRPSKVAGFLARGPPPTLTEKGKGEGSRLGTVDSRTVCLEGVVVAAG